MKRSKKGIKAASYVAGIFAIAAAMLLVVFLVLSVLGLIHPRKERITLHTDSISKIYDAMPLQGSYPAVTFGSLHPEHTLEVRNLPEYSQVGEYSNAPEFVILDGTGADVTDQYSVLCDFGKLTIQPREIVIGSLSKSKVYDGEPMTSEDFWVVGDTLVEGHEIVWDGGTTVVLPGVVKNQPSYRILSAGGADVTNQYAVTEKLGDLEIRPIELTVATESAQKAYDGQSLSAQKWEHIGGRLLEGHTVHMDVTASLSDVGSVFNEGQAWVIDENGKDVSALYQIHYDFGTLQIEGIPLYITTQSAQKVYDGTPLRCEQWALTKGALEEGATIQVKEYPVHNGVGSIDNAISFLVTDRNGRDVTFRYSFICDYGTLSIQPRAITIRTGSASKIYDGTPLSCDAFELISGSLCENENIKITCTSQTEVGYSENFVLDCTVYRMEADGSVIDVSACYRITFDFGMLKITDR